MQVLANLAPHRVHLLMRHPLLQVHPPQVAAVRLRVRLLLQVVQVPLHLRPHRRVLRLLMRELVVPHLHPRRPVLQALMQVQVVPLPPLHRRVPHHLMPALVARRHLVLRSVQPANLEPLALKLRFPATCQVDNACVLRLLPVQPAVPAPHPHLVEHPRPHLRVPRLTPRANLLTLLRLVHLLSTALLQEISPAPLLSPLRKVPCSPAY